LNIHDPGAAFDDASNDFFAWLMQRAIEFQ
jgi:hypothetical protein